MIDSEHQSFHCRQFDLLDRWTGEHASLNLRPSGSSLEYKRFPQSLDLGQV
jgi:hypothetical protein